MTDDEPTIRLTRRRVLGGAVGVGLAAAGAGAGTFALFSDEGSSSGNTVQAGTLEVSIDGSATDTGAFTVAGLEPGAPGSTSGASVFTGTIGISDSGTITPNHLELAFSANVAEAGSSNGADTAPSSATGFDTLIEVTSLDYGGNELIGTVSDANSNGIVDLDDVTNAGVFDDLAAPGSNTDLTIDGNFVDTAAGGYTGGLEDDDFQGDEVEIVVDAAVAQNSSQDVL